jgi:hypothetical protein
MDDQSISWMISGGLRAESRESRLQREHRLVLRDAIAAPDRDPAGGWRERLTSAFRVETRPTPTATLDCCAA